MQSLNEPTPSPGPLSGARIIDLSAVVSGPMAAVVLADQGAEVIKVEPPGWGDGVRYLGASRGGVSCLLYTSPSPRDRTRSRMPSSA